MRGSVVEHRVHTAGLITTQVPFIDTAFAIMRGVPIGKHGLIDDQALCVIIQTLDVSIPVLLAKSETGFDRIRHRKIDHATNIVPIEPPGSHVA